MSVIIPRLLGLNDRENLVNLLNTLPHGVLTSGGCARLLDRGASCS
jgi:hypothetical protein